MGTTAAEFTSIFARVAPEDPHVVAVMTSRKIIQSYASALAAAKVIEERPAYARARIAVVDSTVTDVGAGLVALVAGEAAKSGISHALAVQTLEAVAARTTFVLVVSTLDNLVRGGRAGFLRAWLAERLDLKPLIGFVDGNLKGVGRVSGKADRVVELASAVGKMLLHPKKVWVGISHGGAPEDALRLEEHVRRTLPVEYVYRQRLSASIYLHGGPGALCLAVTELDGLAWTPTVPPPFSEKS